VGVGGGRERERERGRVRRARGEEKENHRAKESSRTGERAAFPPVPSLSPLLPESIIPYHGSVGCRSTPLTRSVRWEKRFCW